MIYALLFSLLACHFLCDFVLVTPAMLKSKATGEDWGIVTHAASHAVAMLLAMLLLQVPREDALMMALAQVTTHAVIDTVKCGIGLRWPCDQTVKRYWILFGADQLLHQAVIVGMVLVIVTVPHPH